jgi:uncharacterized protein
MQNKLPWRFWTGYAFRNSVVAARMNLPDKFARVSALKPNRPTTARAPSVRAPQPEDALSRLLGAAIATNKYGEHVLVRNWYSTPEFSEPFPGTLDLLSHVRDKADCKRAAALSQPEKWLFLDTETTGIAGGTGTYAFLIGLAWWDAGGLQVEQFIMRDFAEEHAILHGLAARIAERPVLVTFNGKTFDWPLLENRFTLTRTIRVPRLAAHVDLLHPARAIWKFRLGTVRLVDLEREVLDPFRLGWSRKDDVATSLIPQFYFDYLRGGPPGPLASVVRHNQMDLRGLAALFGRINRFLSAERHLDSEAHGLDLFGLSRFLQRRGEPARAHFACSQALSLGLPPDLRPQARSDLAMLAKRRGEHEKAAELWHALVADESAGLQACIQLAMYYERHAKQLDTALEFGRLALAKVHRLRRISRDPAMERRHARVEQTILHRVSRLEHRMRLGRGSPTLPIAPHEAGTRAVSKRWACSVSAD